MSFSEARRRAFSSGTPVSTPPSSVNGFSQQNKAKINAVKTFSNLIAKLLFVPHSTQHVHVINAPCVVPWPLERTLWRLFAVQFGDCKHLKLLLSMQLYHY